MHKRILLAILMAPAFAQAAANPTPRTVRLVEYLVRPWTIVQYGDRDDFLLSVARRREVTTASFLLSNVLLAPAASGVAAHMLALGINKALPAEMAEGKKKAFAEGAISVAARSALDFFFTNKQAVKFNFGYGTKKTAVANVVSDLISHATTELWERARVSAQHSCNEYLPESVKNGLQQVYKALTYGPKQLLGEQAFDVVVAETIRCYARERINRYLRWGVEKTRFKDALVKP